MKAFITCLLTLLTLNFTLPNNAHAYLDAGTGSIILQAVLAGVAGGFVMIKMYWSKLTGIFKSNKN